MKPVNILPEVYNKIMFWVDKCPKEVGGFGKVIVKDGAYWIISAHLLEQEVTHTETEIDDVALAKLMADTVREEGHLNFWWHSHVNMGTFWSGTDKDTIKNLGSKGMLLATVFNKKHETRTAYHQGGDDFFPEIAVDNLKLNIMPMLDDADNALWAKEMELKVKEKKFATGTHLLNQGGNTALGYWAGGKWNRYEDDPYETVLGLTGTVGEAAADDPYDIPYGKQYSNYQRVGKAEKKKWQKLYQREYGWQVGTMAPAIVRYYNEHKAFDIDVLLTQTAGA